MSGGCEWESFKITPAEYQELVSELLAVQDAGYKQLPPPPEWVASPNDWLIWLMEQLSGVPAKEHHRLSQECEALEKAMRDTISKGDKALVAELHLKSIQAGNKLAEFVRQHCRRKDEG